MIATVPIKNNAIAKKNAIWFCDLPLLLKKTRYSHGVAAAPIAAAVSMAVMRRFGGMGPIHLYGCQELDEMFCLRSSYLRGGLQRAAHRAYDYEDVGRVLGVMCPSTIQVLKADR